MVLTNPREIKEDSERVMLLLQQLRPGFWEQWAEIERNHKPFDAIRKAVIDFLREQEIVEKNGADTLSEARYFSFLRKKILEQNGLWAGSTIYSNDDIMKVIDHIKKKRPDLWEEWGRCERAEESISHITWDITFLIDKLGITKDNVDIVHIKGILRRKLRMELGLFVFEGEELAGFGKLR